MIFHITVANRQFRVIRKLTENLSWIFSDDIREHIQTSAMGHAEHDLFQPLLCCLFDSQVQQWDQRFAPFQRKAFGADKLFADELLKRQRIG